MTAPTVVEIGVRLDSLRPPAAKSAVVSDDRPANGVMVGTAAVTRRNGIVSTTFTYDPGYLATPGAWALSPDLPLAPGGAAITGLPGALTDATPDGWGRNLLRSALHAGAHGRRRTGGAITDLDHLLGASDLTRMGALRLMLGNDPTPVSTGSVMPSLGDLHALLDAAGVVGGNDTGEDRALAVDVLVGAGSASLGGSRPKAPVVVDGIELIAKFPRHDDEWNVPAWEKTALDLAELCGINAPNRRLVDVGGVQVLLVERFDRDAGHRIPYLSARALLGVPGSAGGAGNDYVAMAEALGDHGGSVADDLRQLWRRAAMSVAVHNTDDHLGNHGVVLGSMGWTLSPVFDVNPDPDPAALRATSINGVTNPTLEVDALIDAAPHFGLSAHEAAAVMAEVEAGVSHWRQVATANGLPEREQRWFASVLDGHHRR